MNNPRGIELSGKDVYKLAARDFTQLRRTDLSLNVPDLDDTLLIHDDMGHGEDSIQLNVDVITPGESLVIAREDKVPIQAKNIKFFVPWAVRPMLFTPIPQLYITRNNISDIWSTGVEEENIQDMATWEEFIYILSMGALSKQTKLDNPPNQQSSTVTS